MRRRLWTRTRVWRQAEVTVDAVRHENVQRIVLDENSAGGERGTLRLTVVRAVHLGQRGGSMLAMTYLQSHRTKCQVHYCIHFS